MSARMLEAPLQGVGTVLRLERDEWSMPKTPRQGTETRGTFLRSSTPLFEKMEKEKKKKKNTHRKKNLPRPTKN